jgi:nicotinate-nucleotide--dimethylbenzimidazole phosphoribosyltransferase
VSIAGDLVRTALADLPEPDAASRAAVAMRAADALRPSGAFARLDEIAVWLAGWQHTDRPRVERPAVVVFVSDHGVVAEGVSAYPADVTAEMLGALRSGRATATVMAREFGALLEVVDVGVGRPTGNLLREPALTYDRFADAWNAGRQAIAALDADMLVLGEMGIGNTTAAAAVCAAIFGGPASQWTGRGTGVDDATLRRKRRVVSAARRRIGGESDPIEILRQLGGAELVAIAGATVEARRRSIPVILDGFVVGTAVAPIAVAKAGSLDHCLAGHVSAEPGHRRLLTRLGMEPILDLGLRLGEGSGALAALPLVQLAAACVSDVATFDEWGLRQ